MAKLKLAKVAKASKVKKLTILERIEQMQKQSSLADTVSAAKEAARMSQLAQAQNLQSQQWQAANNLANQQLNAQVNAQAQSSLQNQLTIGSSGGQSFGSYSGSGNYGTPNVGNLLPGLGQQQINQYQPLPQYPWNNVSTPADNDHNIYEDLKKKQQCVDCFLDDKPGVLSFFVFHGDSLCGDCVKLRVKNKNDLTKVLEAAMKKK